MLVGFQDYRIAKGTREMTEGHPDPVKGPVSAATLASGHTALV